MSRDRVNPFKGIPCSFKPKETTVVALTCIPFREGYYATRFDVLKLCLASLLKHTDTPFDLLVFDNGSVPEVVDYLTQLREDGKIQYLLSSEKNLGYLPALHIAFSAAPGEHVAYCDDDVFFYPNWLSQHLEVLKTYPKVGLVSGRVVGGNGHISSVPPICQEYGIHMELFETPKEWGESWSVNLGKEPDWWAKQAKTQNYKQYLLEYKGVKAFSGAQSISFVFRKSILKEMAPLREKTFVGDDGMWRKAIDDLGYMQLSTYRKTADHIGNVIDDFWKKKAEQYGIRIEQSGDGDTAVTFRKRGSFYKRVVWRLMTECVKRL